MEQIVKSILKQQGIDQIGIFDQEKDIWIYVKEEEVHFCTSNLAPIDREAIGLDQNLIIFTNSNGFIHIVRDNETFTNFVVINSANKILLHKEEVYYISSPEYFVLHKADNDNFIIVGKEDWERCSKNTPSGFCVRYMWMNIVRNSFVFIEKEYKPNYNLCYYVNYTFFIENSHEEYRQIVIALQKGKGIIYQGRLDYLWIHKNGKAEIISFGELSYTLVLKNDNEEKTEDYLTSQVNIKKLDSGMDYSYKVSDFINHIDIEHNNTELMAYEDKRLFSENYLVVPFVYGYGAFIIQYVDGELSAHTISFIESYEINRYRSYRIVLVNEIIKITVTYDGCSDIDNYYYDISGNYLGHTFGKGRSYLTFTNSKGVKLPSGVKVLMGIIKVDDQNIKVLVPPIYNNVEIIDYEYGLFKVWIRDYANGDINIWLYSEISGLIAYDGYLSTPQYSNYFGDYEEPCDYYSNYDSPIASCVKCNMFQIYWQGEYTSQYGLLYLGEKVLDAYYDEIKGFDFVDDFGDNKSIVERTKQYKPLSVIVCKSDLFGLFYKADKGSAKDYDFISPTFDYIRCEKIFKGHAYFRVRKDGKYGIISDSFIFNKNFEIVYDNVLFKAIVGDSCYFTVEKSGKVGAICTQKENDIPLIFDEIDEIVNSGVICNDVLYNKNGEKILSLKDKYHYLKTLYYDVFESNEFGTFLFVNSQGTIMSYYKDKNDPKILHISGSKHLFDVKTKDFIDEEEKDDSVFFTEDNYKYERDTYYALGGDDYDRWKENGSDLDGMMQGMGF